ncbi:efflux RND transporter periplasmic adaptor subunit [Actinomadura geliboluensis]|uniref:HlyD family efflux transporter periplasmic adaptor subunit n=1 Tax=Actinomadura geliboluensis TaxID=882440 RepID=A0A5S4H975_9ACTN|nr:peptidoglycan-binding protein [Actinomadura geliboluensis]TMR41697.1 HlyD family efflux transporter periplasmic adaptor subunit [Actinomadura geliboluensis]
MKRKTVIGITTAVVVAGGGAGGAISVAASSGGEPRQDAGVSTAEAPVKYGDLSDTTSADGTLGYGGQRKIMASGDGTVTWIRSPGSTVRMDDMLYELDGRPVRLMYGKRPMYRQLKTGVEGPDVRQVEKSLRALGHGGGLTVDSKFTAATSNAIKRWQRAHDAKATGTVGPNDIVFVPGPIRVISRDASPGGRVAPGQPVMTSSGTDRVVNLKLTAGEVRLLKNGTKVTVELPGNRNVTATVRSVGTTAVQEEGNGPDGEAKVNVVVKLDDPKDAGNLNQAPVTVRITTQTRKNVLSVPVQALLALPGGGFGVRVVAPGETRMVRVELGIFGQGRVEVTGDGIKEGMKVEVPTS